MDTVSRDSMAEVSIDLDLLKPVLDSASSSGNGPLKSPSTSSMEVFKYKFPLTQVNSLENGSIETERYVKVGLANDDHGNLLVVAPTELIKSLKPGASNGGAKRRKLNQSRPRHIISTLKLPEAAVSDGLLCHSLGKSNLPFADTHGPYLVLQKDNEVILTYGASIVAERVVNSRNQQNIGLRFLSRVFEDPSLVDPLAYQASPLDLLKIITRVPSKSKVPQISIKEVRTDLLPYQRESVIWCLRREGKEVVNGQVNDLDTSIRDYIVSPPLGWRQVPGSDIWVNPYLLKTTSGEPQITTATTPEYKGRGILAEEMGLGKTLEMISLILLNPRKKYLETSPAEPQNPSRSLIPSKATLVIVPRTILHQWVSEVKLHAPHLKTMIVTNPNPPIEELLDADLVLVTYTQLSRWLPHTVIKQKRKARATRTMFDIHVSNGEDDELSHEEHHSTLIDVEFWRVILDEVQMVHTGSSAAAQVARRIPRVHAWAASGTPVKHSLEDLRGITYFLDLHPFVERPCWQRLISSPIDFLSTMELVAIRHTKAMVADQLHIPKQHRRLILLKCSAVERARYDRLFKEFLEDAKNVNCNLSLWLLRLRQACSHAVASGGTNNLPGNLSNGVGGDFIALTLDQVLAQLVEEADLELWIEQRDKFNLQLQLGQLYDISYQMPKALAEWTSIVDRIKELLKMEEPRVNQLTSESKDLQKKVDDLGQKLGAKVEGDDYDDSDDDVAEQSYDNTGEDSKAALEESEDEKSRVQKLDEDATLFDLKRALAIANNRVKSIKARCKSLRELLHRAYFFLGTGYFRTSKRLRMKLSQEELDSDSVKAEIKDNFANETKFYDLAEALRGEILLEAAERVTELSKKSRALKFIKIHRICPIPKAEIADKLASFAQELFKELEGILTQPLLEEANTVHHDVSEKTETSDKKGEDSKEQEDADAYAKTLDLQEFAFVYLEILQILLRDRAANINGGNIQPRPTAAATESQSKELTSKLLDRREDIVSMLHYDRMPLTSMMKSAGVDETTISELKSEIRNCQIRYSLLRDLYNSRVEYYRQLQDLSDQVTDIDVGTRTDYDALIMHKIRDINKSDHKIREKWKTQTYLRNLEGLNHGAQQRAEDLTSSDKPSFDNTLNELSDDSKCTICLEPIADGALTPCGHFFCEDCLFNWLSTRNRCPLCNRGVNTSEVHKFRSGERLEIKTEPAESLKAGTDAIKGSAEDNDSDDLHASDLYVPISNKLYNRIQRVHIPRMYGVKIDMIVRHAKYLRSQDPSAQIVIFSQWGTMLKILKTAFAENRVSVASTTDSVADVNAFRTNPNVACLLLHAKADVAGLTLVNANHVFLCEPLMNTALEFQAVSRINRIGQTRETMVWQFCVEDTVEQTILGITTKARLLQTTVDGSPDPDDSVTVEKASTQGSLVDKRSGAEIIGDSNYLRRILFKSQSVAPE